MWRWAKSRRISPRCWTGSRAFAALALQHLELRRGAGAEEAEIAADREETDAALGAGHRPFGIGAVETRDLAGLAAGLDDLVERRFHRGGMRIELGAVAQSDGEIRRSDEQHIDAGNGRDRVEVSHRGLGFH